MKGTYTTSAREPTQRLHEYRQSLTASQLEKFENLLNENQVFTALDAFYITKDILTRSTDKNETRELASQLASITNDDYYYFNVRGEVCPLDNTMLDYLIKQMEATKPIREM